MKCLLALLGFVLLQPVVLAQDSKPRDMHEMHRLHQDPKAYIAMLDDPARDAYQKPHEVITELDLKPGEAVADIGAGSGYFAFRLAHHVGDAGRVYADLFRTAPPQPCGERRAASSWRGEAPGVHRHE